MSASVNRMTVLGNVGRDPDVHRTLQGRTVVTFPLATHEHWVDAQGETHEQTEWHNVVVWGKQAAACATYVTKGRQVYVEGSLRSRRYDDPNGEPRAIIEIIARQVQFLGGRSSTPDRADRAGSADESLEFLPDEEFD